MKKKSMTKAEYLERFSNTKKIREQVKRDKWCQNYHIMPLQGWLNDPNGLHQKDGIYHIYYQYSPFDVDGYNKLWAHVSSEDLIKYKFEEPIFYPDSDYDKDGVYSGSAFIKNGIVNFFYTGNIKLEGDYDYINNGRISNTIKVISKDSKIMGKKELIIGDDDYPKNMSKHIRDPKIYEEKGLYYLILGARDINSKAMVIIYKSEDLENFKYHMTITSDYNFGYMWECPDLIEMDGQKYLICSPQGVKSQEFKYQNIYQTGYFPIDIDFDNKSYSLGDFEEFDYGFDFYACQSFKDEKNRNILIAWLGIPDADYTNPTRENGWQHCLTIARRLESRNKKLFQVPLKEYEKLRKDEIMLEEEKEFYLSCFEMISGKIKDEFEIFLRKDVTISYKKNILSLSMAESGYGRNIRKIKLDKIINLRIFSDNSSLEIFVNDGEFTITTKVFSESPYLKIRGLEAKIYKLGKFIWI